MAADFDATADELYALAPQRFVEERDTAAREAKKANAETAKAIRALKKPSTAAWLLNQLVRAKRDDVTSLLDLGAALRQAQSRLEGAQLRELSKQRRLAVNALVREARQLAAQLGNPASESVAREVEQTLEAALTSPDAAAAVESGRLTTALSPDAGFDSATPHLRVVRESKQQAGRRAEADRAASATEAKAAAETVKRAEQAAREAAAQLVFTTTRREQATDRVADLTSEIANLTSQLQTLEQELTDAKRAVRDADKEVTASERAARRADLAVEAARNAQQNR